MLQAIFHLWGDYITQSSWMANTKTKPTMEGFWACLIHCTLYTIPFLFIGSFQACMTIFITHYFIDSYRLAKYVNAFKNATYGHNGWNIPDTSTGYAEETPVWLSTWLLFITDNTLHVTINYLSLKYL